MINNSEYKSIIFDLRSDTVTKPSIEMYTAMKNASYCDAFLEEDISTKKLEELCIKLFGFEDAVFTVSGTMSNQLAIKSYTVPGDEIVTDYSYHINYYEASSVSSLSGVHINTTRKENGLINIEDLEKILSDRSKSHFSGSIKLICLENTINYHAGKIFPFKDLKIISDFAKYKKLPIHIDGARIFNALVEENIAFNQMSLVADSIMLSFTKGLGAPFGSVLMGTKDFIKKAKKYNKWFGGGMHQSGLMAECALYALQNNVKEIKLDNDKAKNLVKLLAPIEGYGVKISKVETNIIMLDFCSVGMSVEIFVNMLKNKNILVYFWSDYKVRLVMHRDICVNDISFISKVILEAFESSKK